MKNVETNYSQPHHVMLIFRSTISPGTETESIISDRCQYYQKLKKEDKVLFYGNFWNQDKAFIILYIKSATELEEIINNDPGLTHQLIELERAMPFTQEENFDHIMQW